MPRSLKTATSNQPATKRVIRGTGATASAIASPLVDRQYQFFAYGEYIYARASFSEALAYIVSDPNDPQGGQEIVEYDFDYDSSYRFGGGINFCDCGGAIVFNFARYNSSADYRRDRHLDRGHDTLSVPTKSTLLMAVACRATPTSTSSRTTLVGPKHSAWVALASLARAVIPAAIPAVAILAATLAAIPAVTLLRSLLWHRLRPLLSCLGTHLVRRCALCRRRLGPQHAWPSTS